MSRQDDEKELRKLEYLERRGVATWTDSHRRKVLARKLALEDFEESEDGRATQDDAQKRAIEKLADEKTKKAPGKKGTLN